MNAVRVSWLFLKLGVLNELQYRVNFFVSLLQAAIALVTGLVVLALVYSHTDGAERLDAAGAPLRPRHPDPHGRRSSGRHPAEHDSARSRTSATGSSTIALTKPEDAQVLVSVREVRIWQAVDIVSGLIVLAVGLSRVTTDFGAADAAAFAVSLVFGAVLIYCFWLVIATVAFWVVNMWHAVELFDGDLPDRSLADRHLPDVASRRRHVPRADRVRRHRPRGGADVAARLADTRCSRPSSRSLRSPSPAGSGGSG